MQSMQQLYTPPVYMPVSCSLKLFVSSSLIEAYKRHFAIGVLRYMYWHYLIPHVFLSNQALKALELGHTNRRTLWLTSRWVHCATFSLLCCCRTAFSTERRRYHGAGTDLCGRAVLLCKWSNWAGVTLLMPKYRRIRVYCDHPLYMTI